MPFDIRRAKRMGMTYDKLLRLLKLERKRLDQRIAAYVKMLILQGEGRRIVVTVKKMGR